VRGQGADGETATDLGRRAEPLGPAGGTVLPETEPVKARTPNTSTDD
jgi:hypothetical protein